MNNDNYTQILNKNLLISGYKARQRYIQNMTFLSTSYNHSELLIKSSDRSQTIKNGYLILNGLYPINTGPLLNKNFPLERALPPYVNLTLDDSLSSALPNEYQPIPIHNTHYKEDFLFNAHNICPTYMTLVQTQQNSTEYKFYREKGIMFAKNILKNMSLNGSNYEGLSENIEQFIQNVSLNKFNNSQMFQLNNLTTIGEMLAMYRETSIKLQVELALNSFLIYFSNIFKQKLKSLEQNTLKYVLFLGEQQLFNSLIRLFNISSFECLLDVLGHYPGSHLNCVNGFSKIGAQILFELYSNENQNNTNNNNEKNKYYVKVLYNGEEMNLFEAGNFKSSAFEFFSYLESFKMIDFKKECKFQKKKKKIANNNFMKNKKLQEAEDEIQANYEFITALIILETFLIIGISVLIYFRKKKFI